MPTDKSTIRWACDLCGTEWGGATSHESASACEATGAPDPLPDGTWVLQSGYATNWDADTYGGIRMEKITGHTVTRSDWMQYTPPRQPEPHRIRYNSRLNDELSSTNLHPNKPGVLNVFSIAGNLIHEDRLESVLKDESRATELVDVLAAFGVDTKPHYLQKIAHEAYHSFDFGAGDWWSPKMLELHGQLPPLHTLEPAVVAALRAVAKAKTVNSHQWAQRVLFDQLHHSDGNTALARARALTTHPAALVDRVERWWAGEDVTIPAGALTGTGGTRSSGGNLTISVGQRDAMRAAGFKVPWPAKIRNVPEDIINTPEKALKHLLAAIPLLETTMNDTNSLFPVENILAVASGKGGVGKTTVAAALGRSLTKAGRGTLLIDLDFHGPSLGHLLQLPPLTVTDDGKIIPTLLPDGTRALSLAQLLTDTTPVVWRGAAVEGFLLFLAARLDLTGVDTIVFDLPPGTGEVEAAVLKYAKPHGAILVTTGSDLSHADCRRTDRFLNSRRVPILGVVENLSRRTVTTPAGEEMELRIFGEEADTVAFVESLAYSTDFGKRYAPPYLGSLPFTADPQVMAGSSEFATVAAAALECAPERRDPERVGKRTLTVTMAVEA